MPLLKLQTSVPVPANRQDELARAVSRLLAEATGKPEKYVMVMLETSVACMAGASGPAAFADVRGIGGLSGAVNAEVTRRLCELLERELSIAPDRVYAVFTDVAASNWGWDGRTFG